MIRGANITHIKAIYPEHTRIASVEVPNREHNVSTSALMVGLRSNLPAVRERLQQRLAVAFEREVRGPEDCNGMFSYLPKNCRDLNGNRLDTDTCRRR